jgi:hypothetical protein
MEIVPIGCLEGDGDTPFAYQDHSLWELIARDEFTGLLDRNGKEIYRDDFVRVIRHDTHEDNWKDEPIHRVRWWSDAAGFFFSPALESNCGDYCVTIGAGEQEEFDLEVVGNLYENPELVKVKK